MSHLNTRMPTGNDVTQRRDLKSAFSNDLFEQVLQRDNLHRAWKRVRANKGAAGVDGMAIDGFLDLPPFLTLDSQTTVLVFDRGEMGNKRLSRCRASSSEGRHIAADVDLSKFFDRVNHDLLMTHLGYKVKDRCLLKLIKCYLQAGVMDNLSYRENHAPK